MERTKEEQFLILDTLVKERSLIIANICQVIKDGRWIGEKEEGYKSALEDEIESHRLALKEYKEGIEKLNNNQ